MTLETGIYDHFVFLSPDRADFFSAWPGIHMFQAGAVWTLYLHDGERQRPYDIFYGDEDALTEWMRSSGYPHREARDAQNTKKERV